MVFHGGFPAQNPTVTDHTKNTQQIPGVFYDLIWIESERNHFPTNEKKTLIVRGKYGSIALLAQNLSLRFTGRQGTLALLIPSPIDKR